MNKPIIFLLGFIFLQLTLVSCEGQNAKFEKTDKGVIIDTEQGQIALEVFDENIIHVVANNGKIADSTNRKIVDFKPVNTNWEIFESEQGVGVSTNQIKVIVNTKTGALVYYDKNDNVLLAEPDSGGRVFKENTIYGNKTQSAQQNFLPVKNEAFYGLGSNHTDKLNLRHANLDLYQQNTEIFIPFFVSSKNYGILWDNYGHNRLGTSEDAKLIPTSTFIDTAKNAGRLTAEFYSDINFKNPVEKKGWDGSMDFNALLDKSEDINSVRLSGTIDINEAGEYELIKEERGKLSVFIDDERVMEVWQTILSTPRYTHIDLSKGTHKIVIEYTQQKDEFPTLKWRKPSEKNELLSLWSAAAKNIDYYFIYGEENMDQVVSGFRKLTGKATLLPKWAYGFWQSRNRYQSQEEIVSMAKKLRGNEIPFDNIVLDWHYWVNDTWGSHTFNEKAFPDASAMTDELHDLNANVMISVWPKFYPETANYKELETAGALYTKFADEKGVDFRNHLNTYYDPFNPEGREIYWNQINREIYSHGFDAWWLDGTEPSFDKDFDANKRAYYMEPNAFGKGYDYLNLFALYNSKAIYEGQRSVDPNKRAFILTRSSFAGMQKYAAVAWSGDVAASWDMFRSEIAAGLNYSLSGMPYWTDDIGGYISEMRDGTYFYDEFEELFTRWFQFGTFSPIFRAHGDQHPQNMLAFKKDYFEAQLKFDKLRYSLMPYIYSVAGAVTHDDYTMMRGLVFDFADDPKVLDITDQFMFGPSLLICPVTEYEARKRDVYLPATTDWYDFWTGKYYKGGKSYSVTAPLDQMPIFVKAGSIIPFGPEIQYTSEKKPESILLKVYEGANAAFELYEDEGTNYNYQDGAFSEINISWDDKTNLLKISDSKGEYKGMLKDRKFQVELVSEKSPSGYNDEPKPIKKTDYSGKQVELDLN